MDLIERLRARTFRPVDNIEQAFNEQGNLTQGDALLHEEAAAELARLRAEVEELRQRFRTYSFGQVVRLSDPEMKATVDAIKRRIKEEPGFGKALLQSAGILDAKGGFAEMYADAALTNRKD